MDRANPAVDIGGSTGSPDALAARLRSMGGWRELLWRVAGHYDRLHVAKDGGFFQSYGQGGSSTPATPWPTTVPERLSACSPWKRGAPNQYDLTKRKGTRAKPHFYLDYGTPHNARDGIRPSEACREEWNVVKEAAQREDRNLRRLSEQDSLTRMGVAGRSLVGPRAW